jgi:hypothetical protein
MHTLTLRARLIAAGCAAAALWGIGAGAWAISQSLAPPADLLRVSGNDYRAGNTVLPGSATGETQHRSTSAGGCYWHRDARCGAGARSRAALDCGSRGVLFSSCLAVSCSQSRSSAWCSVVRSVSSSRTSCTLPPIAVAIYHPTAQGAAQSIRHSSGVTCSWIIEHSTFCHCYALLSYTRQFSSPPGSQFPVLGSQPVLVPGSWFLVPGSWFLVPGSWFLVLGSWFLVPGSWFLVLGSWFLVLGSWFLVLTSHHAPPQLLVSYTLMKALILSDVHSNIVALEAIWAREGDADAIYCAGDLVDYGVYPRETLAWMRAHNVVCVQGNHDRQVAETFLRTGALARP